MKDQKEEQEKDKDEKILSLTGEVERLKKEIAHITDVLKEQYEFRWSIRNHMLNSNGVDCKQTDDLRGVTMPDGTFVQYGKEYHLLYFIGRIK